MLQPAGSIGALGFLLIISVKTNLSILPNKHSQCSSLPALQLWLLASVKVTVTSRAIFLFEPPRLGPGSPELVPSVPHKLVCTFFKHLPKNNWEFQFFPLTRICSELQLHVSYLSQRLLGARAGVPLGRGLKY